MLYHPFPLKCFNVLKEETLSQMSQSNTDQIYIKPIIMPNDIMNMFDREMSEYGLSGSWNFLCFKRKNFINETNNVHIDYSFEYESYVYSSIVIPVEGCEDTHMYWMDGTYEVTRTIQASGPRYLKLNWKSTPTLLDRVEIANEPILTRVDVPHSATSRKDGSYRTTLSVRLLGNPYFDDIINKRFLGSVQQTKS